MSHSVKKIIIDHKDLKYVTEHISLKSTKPTLFALQSLSVYSRYDIPGVHIPVHAHRHAFLFGIIERGAWLRDALTETFIRHLLKKFLCIGNSNLSFDLLHQLLFLCGIHLSTSQCVSIHSHLLLQI